MKSILLLGSRGRLGSSFKDFFLKKKINFCDYNIKDNKKKFSSINKILKVKKINIVINCTGLVDVDLCNRSIGRAIEANSKSVKTISDAINSVNKEIIFVHFSTDQIYNSLNSKASIEKDVSLSNNYSISKFLGEIFASQVKKNIIIRTNFFGPSANKKKFSYTDFLIKNLKKKKIKIPSNVFFNPILIDDLVKNTIYLIKKKTTGTFNIGSSTCMSKYDFVLKLAEIKKLPKKNIIPYKSIYEKNKRPLFTVMSIKKLQRTTKQSPPSLYESLLKLK